MKRYNYSDLTKQDIQKLVQRNVDPANEIRAIVEDVIAHVNEHGDSALFDYALKFDKVELNKLYLVKEELEEIADLIDEGKVSPVIGKVFSLEQAAEAQELSKEGHVQGKIVLKVVNE